MSFAKFTPRPARQWGGDSLPTARTPALRLSDGPRVLVLQAPKLHLVRSKSYRRYVASHACFKCSVAGFSQAAHPNFGKGLGMKACDTQCFPLCGPRPDVMGCHIRHDTMVEFESCPEPRDARRITEAIYVERMQTIARKAGRKELA